MLTLTRLVAVAAFGAACAPIACAEFAVGNAVFIQGIAGPENGYTYWGSNINGQDHLLGDVAQPFEDATNTQLFVGVTSWVNSASSVTFSFDFSQYNPGAYTLHALEIFGLKNDGSIASVSASQGFAYVQDGNKIRWDGLGIDLAETPKLVLEIQQVPAPGVFALLGVAGLAGRRRRA